MDCPQTTRKVFQLNAERRTATRSWLRPTMMDDLVDKKSDDWTDEKRIVNEEAKKPDQMMRRMPGGRLQYITTSANTATRTTAPTMRLSTGKCTKPPWNKCSTASDNRTILTPHCVVR